MSRSLSRDGDECESGVGVILYVWVKLNNEHGDNDWKNVECNLEIHWWLCSFTLFFSVGDYSE